MNAPASFNAPPAALIVISGGPSAALKQAPDPAFHRLLGSLPAAQRVLALGSDTGELGKAYTSRHPGSQWVGVDGDASHALQSTDGPFDLIVVNRLERLPQAATVLAELGALLAPGAEMVVLAENHARLSTMAHLIEADLSTGQAATPHDTASMDLAHPRFQSPASIYKLLLDAGWMPTLADSLPDDRTDDRMAAAARYMGDVLGVPQGCADRVQRMKHLVIRAKRLFDDAVPPSSQALFDVVVPTTKEQQLRVNVEQSPGLSEVQARIISYRHAASPAEALGESLQHVQCDWVLLCHQDIYLPKGFGQRLNALLATIPIEERRTTLLGFMGMGVNRDTELPDPSGFVIDRLNWADQPASDTAVSIDELAIVIARDSLHRIDPLIGWHLWATDLCLTSVCTHRVFPRIVRMPIFHNSQSGWSLPDAFIDSAEYLLQKHPSFDTIHTLCGVIDQGFVARHRSTQP